MKSWTLVKRSLRFHARSHVGVVLGAAISSASLIGALLVGDSVRQSLRDRALARLGPVHYAVGTPDRLFRTELVDRLLRELRSAPVVTLGSFRVSSGGSRIATYSFPAHRLTLGMSLGSTFLGAAALQLPGVAARQDGSARANRVSVLGVDAQAWPGLQGWAGMSGNQPQSEGGVGGGPPTLQVGASWNQLQSQGGSLTVAGSPGLGPRVLDEWQRGGTALLNETLARQLHAQPGDEIVVRVRKPSALGTEAALSPRDQDSVALRLKVGAVLPTGMSADFSLATQPVPPANLFLPLDHLAAEVGDSGRANLLLFGPMVRNLPIGRWGRLRQSLADWFASRSGQGWVVVPAGARSSVTMVQRKGLSSVFANLCERAARLLEPETETPMPAEEGRSWLAAQIERNWLPEDTGLSVKARDLPAVATSGSPTGRVVEVTSSRIFLEPPVVAAALRPRTTLLTNHLRFGSPLPDTPKDVALSQIVTNGAGVLTYLANLLRAGDRATPYSMVTAAGAPYTPPDMRNDEILLNQWLADDLQAKPGDRVQLSCYIADSGSHLTERTNSFRVRSVVPLAGLYADRTLMPEFPGVAKAESTHDWDTGFPLVYTIRDKDEAYWKQHRGTPKAYVTLAAGQAMWTNRFGSLTAIRYPVPVNTTTSAGRDAVRRNLVANLHPAQVGLGVQSVRSEALKAAAEAQDFGQLFLGFSFFLVIAALLLMALLFQFGVEQRAGEVGTFLALGFAPKQVRHLLLAEGTVLALAGGLAGALGGLGYARAMLWGLATVWRGAVGTMPLEFHASAVSLAIGAAASTLVATLTIWLTLRRQAKQTVRELLAIGGGGPLGAPLSTGRARGPGAGAGLVSALGWARALGRATLGRAASRPGLWGATGVVGALAIAGWAWAKGGRADAEAFFSAGSLLLLAGLALISAWLGLLARQNLAERLSLRRLGVRGCALRRNRSLATVALLASGCFLIASIGVFRLDANLDATRRSSGTGGFAFIGQSALPVVQDLNTPAGREFFGLDAKDLAGVNVVPFRVRDGDDASCLNLNRAQRPRLLGVNPGLLAGRFTFAQEAGGRPRSEAWEALRGSNVPGPKSKASGPGARDPSEQEEIPAIGDANSIQWALGKAVGDTVDYTDDHGRRFKLRLVGAVANSILQGNLIIDEAAFIRRFPNESGCRMFLIDAPSATSAQVSASLSRGLQDAGLELASTADRLQAFNAVQNTYLGTFQVLGGLGLLLGSAGLGVVVLRNVLERRGELGVLLALGFRRRTLHWMVLSEHGALLGLGLGLGLAAAVVAVLPALLSPGAPLPLSSIAWTLAAVLLNGAVWTWAATRFALRADLLATLRNE